MADDTIHSAPRHRLGFSDAAQDAYERETKIEIETRAYIAEESTKHVLETGLLRSIIEPRTAITLFALSLGWFAGAWGFNPAAAILTLIAADIDPTSKNSTLFSIAWSMGLAVGYLLVGRLADICGRRWVIISFNVMGLVGGIVAGTAQSVNTLIGANILIGLAAGAQFAAMVTATGKLHPWEPFFPFQSTVDLTFEAFSELLPNKHKMLTISLVLCLVFPATAMSPYIASSNDVNNAMKVKFANSSASSGRLLYETATWRWIYYIYVIVVAVELVLFFFFYHPRDSVSVLSVRSRLRRLDFGGMILASAGLTLCTLGLSWGGNPKPWTSGLVLGTLISGVGTLVLLILYETYMPITEPFLPMHLFKDFRGFTSLLIVASSAGIAFVGMHIIWPTQALRYFGQNSDWQTVAWLSSTTGMGTWAATVFCGPFWSKIGHVKWQLVFWCVWLTAFTGALMNCRPGDKAFAAAVSFLAGCPVGYLENQAGMLVQLIAPEGQQSTYFGASQGIRTAAGSIGTAVFVAILNNKMQPTIQKYVTKAVLPLGLPKTSLGSLIKALVASGPARTKALHAVPGITPEVMSAAQNAYDNGLVAAYRYMYYAAIAFGVWSIVAALCLRSMDHLLTNHVPKSNGHNSREVKMISVEVEHDMGVDKRAGATSVHLEGESGV